MIGRVTGHGLLMGCLVFYLTIYAAVSGGHRAAVEGFDNASAVAENLSQIDDDVRANLSERQLETQPAHLDWILRLVGATVGPSYRFGHDHPTAASLYLRLSPLWVFGAVAAYVYTYYRQLRRRLR